MKVRLKHNIVVGMRFYSAGSVIDDEAPGFEFIRETRESVNDYDDGPAPRPEDPAPAARRILVHKPAAGVAGGKGGGHLVRKPKRD